MQRLRNVNYFSKPTLVSNEIEIKQQIISTRIFFLLLIVSIIVLISYYGAEHITTTHQIESPTFEQFINVEADQHTNPSFSCPCSTLTVSYEKFVEIQYTLHPICTSDFVQSEWLNYPASLDAFFFDFRTLMPTYFHSFASLCYVFADYINNSRSSFNTSLFISYKALSLEEFAAETDAIVNVFKRTAIHSFENEIAFISDMVQNNGLISTKYTNFVIYLDGTYPSYVINFGSSPHTYISENPSTTCYCFYSTHCREPLSIYLNGSVYSRLLDIPGLFVDCLIIEGIRSSTFSCLFNQSCVDLMSYWLDISSVNAIDIRSLSHFYVNSSIEDMMSEMFVDQWNYLVSHRAFYEECSPAHCAYTLIQHNSFWLILTTVIGLIGGLIKILQPIVPRLVQGVFALSSHCGHREPPEMDPTPARLPFSFQSIKKRIVQFNLFASDDPTADDEREVRDQIIATRIFIVLLIFSLIILTIYSSQVQITKTVTILNPSIEQYTLLYSSHSQTLTCPCGNIVILQEAFLTLQPTFHQICQSSFVDPKWIYEISISVLGNTFSTADFRVFGGYLFDTISSFCQLSNLTITDEISKFGETSYVTIQITPQELLLKQGQSFIDLFISTTENVFTNSLNIIRTTTHANYLQSGFSSSAFIQVIFDDHTKGNLEVQNQAYNESCTCYNDMTCSQPAGLYNYPNLTIIYSIPGFFLSCYVVEATLQSNLASLYNQSWIDEFRARISFDNQTPDSFNATALNSSLDSQYNMTTPINTIAQKMMTERWHTYVNYSAYYEQCHPTECKYTYVVKHDIVYILTTIVGLFGGLVTIFQLVIPRAIKLIRRICLKFFRPTPNHIIPA